MKKNIAVFFGVIIADIITIIIAYGKIIEIKGYLSIVFLLLMFIGTLYIMCRFLNGKKFLNALIAVWVTGYLFALGLFCLREYLFTSRIIEEKSKNGYLYVKYEHNGGAMTSFSYEMRKYFVIVDSDILSVRLVIDSESFEHDDFMPQI